LVWHETEMRPTQGFDWLRVLCTVLDIRASCSLL